MNRGETPRSRSEYAVFAALFAVVVSGTPSYGQEQRPTLRNDARDGTAAVPEPAYTVTLGRDRISLIARVSGLRAGFAYQDVWIQVRCYDHRRKVLGVQRCDISDPGAVLTGPRAVSRAFPLAYPNTLSVEAQEIHFDAVRSVVRAPARDIARTGRPPTGRRAIGDDIAPPKRDATGRRAIVEDASPTTRETSGRTARVADTAPPRRSATGRRPIVDDAPPKPAGTERRAVPPRTTQPGAVPPSPTADLNGLEPSRPNRRRN